MTTSKTYDFGMVGLGVMGRNFLLNVADQGYAIAGMDQSAEQAAALELEAAGKPVKGTTSITEFTAVLKSPRIIMLLVPAGKVVDLVIEDLLPHLAPGDLVIDGGNSYFADTDRRMTYLAEKNIHFFGVGVSGGEEGARRGPSIMPGGNREAYHLVAPIFEQVAAKVNGDPCVAFMGNTSAGHYVKMVHNGIEYALMQLIAETYDLLKNLHGLNNQQLGATFADWNDKELSSYLIEITSEIFFQKDDLVEGALVDRILDKAKQKGTGKWTSQNAMDHGIPVPTIDAAVTMRGLSALKQRRVEAAKIYPPTNTDHQQGDSNHALEDIKNALLFAMIISYAQGMSLLQEVSQESEYELNLAEIAKIWRGGCIIRADLLEDIRKAYATDPSLKNLLLSPVFSGPLSVLQKSCRKVMIRALEAGIPVMAFSGSLSYFDAFRRSRLPLNLTQAQRDYFGAHTYERTDREGIFHTAWNQQ